MVVNVAVVAFCAVLTAHVKNLCTHFEELLKVALDAVQSCDILLTNSVDFKR